MAITTQPQQAQPQQKKPPRSDQSSGKSTPTRPKPPKITDYASI